MNFFLLKCGKIIYAQVTHAEIAFIYNFPGIYISGNINKFGNFPRAENAFKAVGDVISDLKQELMTLHLQLGKYKQGN